MRRMYPIAAAFFAASLLPAQTIPPDAKNACPLPAATFNSWFASGAPAVNGVVNPANSVTFPSIPNCTFYAWSKQMFLWLNSPAPATYGGGGGRIFNSPAFYDVSPATAGQRTFIPHPPGFIRNMAVRVPKAGPHGLPIIFDKTGRMLEVERPLLAPSGKQVIRDQAGALREIDKVTLAPNHKLVFQDTAGKAIQPLRAPAFKLSAITTLNRMTTSITVQKFISGGIPIFIDPAGNVIDVEQGQSDDGVLVAQNGSLVYYFTVVNDVYAYFLTGLKDGGIAPAPTHFPTTQADLNAIVTFAAAHSKTFPDPTALAIEVKSSWVEAAGLPNLSSYITIQATIPTYDKTNPNQWVPNGQKTTTLAMVGMHVVGSTAQHPEMIWATFEHFNNAPNAAYTYTNAANGTTSVAQGSVGNFLFAASGAPGPFNAMNAATSGNDIIPNPPATISPANTMRWRPFGMPGTTPASNSEVISMHNNVNALMPVGDIRSNYYMTGATWTIPGSVPPSGQVGTNQLANTTLETFEQASCTSASQTPCTALAPGSNCFSCHTTITPGTLSHVFGGLKPLF